MSDLARLHHAILTHNVCEVCQLLTSSVDVNAIFQRETAFTQAISVKCFCAADVIIDSKNFDPNAKNQFDSSPLYLSVKERRVDYVTRLLTMGARVNDGEVRGTTPLTACVWTDNVEIAQILIQHGANVNQADRLEQMPLHHACSNVAIRVVRLLLKHNCDVNHSTISKKTPLMFALPSYYNYKVAHKKMSDMLSISGMLIQAGSDLNKQDDKGKTALHLTVECNDIYGMCILAESGCELNIKDDLGHTPFQAAILSRKPLYDLARFLLYYGADATDKISLGNNCSVSPLSLILNNHLQLPPETQWSRNMLLRCLQRCVYPEQTISKSCDIKYDLSSNNNAQDHKVEMEVLEWLHASKPCSLQHQAIVKLRQTLGSRNIIPKINLLPIGPGLKQSLNLGLHPDWVPLSKVCSVHLHIRDQRNDLLKDIVDSGRNINLPVNSKTPLAVAIEIGNTEAAQIILNNPKSRSAVVNTSRDGALHVAAKYKRHEIIDAIINVYADINMKNCRGQTPLHMAIHTGHSTTATTLINKGADLSCLDDDNISLLHMAAASGSSDVVELLLARGMDPNIEDSFQNTPLHVAASKGVLYLQRHIAVPGLYIDMIAQSLDHVQMTVNESLPKYIKKDTGHAQVVQCLIKHGASLTTVNSELKTPFQCAEHVQAVELLDVLNISKL